MIVAFVELTSPLDSPFTTSTPLSLPHQPQDNDISLELYDRSVGEREREHNFMSFLHFSEHHGYHPVAMPTSSHYHKGENQSLSQQQQPEEDKYKRKNPVVAMKRWFR